jgi:hypothetical protein
VARRSRAATAVHHSREVMVAPRSQATAVRHSREAMVAHRSQATAVRHSREVMVAHRSQATAVRRSREATVRHRKATAAIRRRLAQGPAHTTAALCLQPPGGALGSGRVLFLFSRRLSDLRRLSRRPPLRLPLPVGQARASPPTLLVPVAAARRNCQHRGCLTG